MKFQGLLFGFLVVAASSLLIPREAVANESSQSGLVFHCKGDKSSLLVLGKEGGFGLRPGYYEIDSYRNQLIFRAYLNGSRKFENGQTVYEMTNGTGKGKIRLYGFDARLASLAFSVGKDTLKAMIEFDGYEEVTCKNGQELLASESLKDFKLRDYSNFPEWQK